MLIRQFIVTSLILSVSYASIRYFNYNNNNDKIMGENNSDLSRNNHEFILNEGSTCEVKMSAALSVIKTNILYIYTTLDTLGKKNHDLEESINGKFHKLEKNILDKLEEYIEGKLDSMEKHMNRRIDALEKNIPDKTDVIIINQKFDALKKMYTDSDGSLICETKILANETLSKINEEINRKLKMPDIEENIRRRLDMFSKKNPEHLEENINLKLDAMEKSILSLKENISSEFKTLNNSLTQNIKRLDEESSKNKNIVLNRTMGFWDCKKLEVHGYDFKPIRMDDETFNYVTMESDQDGLTRFEMNLAIKSEDFVVIQLVHDLGKDDIYVEIDIGKSILTKLYSRKPCGDRLAFYNTGNMTLSDTKFKALYVKIDKQTLELGEKDTNSTPILKYSNSCLRTVKFIGFTSRDNYKGTVLYDCPPQFEETLSYS